ncbi:class F sortase [Microbacterium aurantiacum]|uniref:class F sortase n=1 Tax=Microbacterium aurantiacum TaxID=162393 RepID=UPI003F4972EA
MPGSGHASSLSRRGGSHLPRTSEIAPPGERHPPTRTDPDPLRRRAAPPRRRRRSRHPGSPRAPRLHWYTPGGRPGRRGPVVIAGHVDSPTGPAVFLRLQELVPGDTVTVTAADGATHDYAVTEVRDVAKDAFPTAEVFGATVTDTLRLITCGGLFDSAAASYTDNRVVFAERA